MSPPQPSRQRQFEEYLRDGIMAVKNGDRKLAQVILNRALLLDKSDARPYVWLSATTDDPDEQREYLETAIAVEPQNAAARRGLALLTGKIDESRMAQHGNTGTAPPLAEESRQAQAQTFECPRCGGRMTFSVATALLTCEYCGYEQDREEEPAADVSGALADRVEQVLDFALPTTMGHQWAQGQHSVSCERCGARNLLPAGQKADICSYCGSNQLIDISEAGDLVDPHVVILMQVDAKQAAQTVREWLGRGFFTPDNLISAVKGLRLRPAYYSAWVFDGTLEVHWSCEVQEGSGRYQRWATRSGVETRFFSDVLVSGVRSLTAKELASIEPFNLSDVQEFDPQYLAGWPTVIYDHSLSDSSLVAREKTLRQIRPQLYSTIEMGREKRNVQIGSGRWSGMTYKHILLPIWIGIYHFKGKEFHLLVNGQTGKVGGDKPRDNVKIGMSVGLVAAFIALAIFIWWLLSTLGGAP